MGSRVMVTKIGLISLGAVLTSLTLSAQAASSKADLQLKMSQQWRERLLPIAESILNQQCGEDCPSFRVDPRFSSEQQDNIDEIGFTKPAEPEKAATLKSVTITVQHSRSLSEKGVESLKQILGARIANETATPVTVTFQALAGPSPLEARLNAADADLKNAQTISVVRAGLWPLCIL